MYNTELRKQAEQILKAEHSELKAYSVTEFKTLVHELKVHQIELELQNEELHKSQAELAISQQKFFELFDKAPIAYFVLDSDKRILQANLLGAEMLGRTQQSLANGYFSHMVAQESQGKFLLMLNRLSQTRLPQSLEVQMVKSDKTLFDAALECVVVQDENLMSYRITMSDTTE